MKTEDQAAALRVRRWVDRPASAETAEGRMHALLREVPAAAPLTADRIARVQARLRAGAPVRRPVRALRWAAVAALLLIANTGGVLAARGIMRWMSAARPVARPIASVPLPAAPGVHRRPTRAPTAPAPQPTPVVESPRPAPVVAAPDVTPRPRRSHAAAAPVSTPPPVARASEVTAPPPEAPVMARALAPIALAPAPSAAPAPRAPAPAAASDESPLAHETRLLARALRQLKQEGDAAAALATLDEYRARFVGGRLRAEAAVTRVDALLALARRDEALELLGTLPLDEVGRGQELRVIRAELRAVRDCAAALDDFDQALARSASGPLQERALHGRAVCRARLGDGAGSQSDLREYLRRFPQGRFAPEARASLPRP